MRYTVSSAGEGEGGDLALEVERGPPRRPGAPRRRRGARGRPSAPGRRAGSAAGHARSGVPRSPPTRWRRAAGPGSAGRLSSRSRVRRAVIPPAATMSIIRQMWTSVCSGPSCELLGDPAPLVLLARGPRRRRRPGPAPGAGVLGDVLEDHLEHRLALDGHHPGAGAVDMGARLCRHPHRAADRVPSAHGGEGLLADEGRQGHATRLPGPCPSRSSAATLASCTTPERSTRKIGWLLASNRSR